MITTSANPTVLSDVVHSARDAQRRWAESSVRERLIHVHAVRRLLYRDVDRLCTVISEEMGKSQAEALGGDVLATADAFRFLEREAVAILRPRHVSGRSRPIWLMSQSDVVWRRPRGVVGIIGTWNYPLFLNGVQIVQALVAGNAVLWKPSELVPRFSKLFHEMLLEAGFAPELIHLLPAVREMGPTLAEAEIDHVVFTGSAHVGSRLASRLGERLISSTMELSGCDAQFILDDADVLLAAKAAWFGVNLNRGQTCIAVRRSFVPRKLYSSFCDALRAMSDQSTWPINLTLASQESLAEQMLDDAVAAGATRLSERAGIVVDAHPDMRICREASFAPILAVIPYDTLEDALKADRQCPYALGASIFTHSIERANKLAPRLRAGAVTVNDVIVPTSHPGTPFGGRASSGWGVTQGLEGLLEMTVPQVVSLKWGAFRPYYDVSDPKKLKNQGEMLRGFFEATHAPNLLNRIKGWWRILRVGMRGF